MEIDTTHHSPNHSPRHGHAITMLVIHATAGSYASALAWLCSPASRVSAHYLQRKDGHTDQLVADSEAAWHAGVARWNGETAINEISLGIELENANDGRDPYPPAQYNALLELATTKVVQYHIRLDNVVRHLDIAIPQGRKTDPAGFPWAKFKVDLSAALAQYGVLRYRAGAYGAVAQQDRRPDAPAAKLYQPGEPFEGDGEEKGYVHDRTGIGFVPLGQVVRL